MLYAVRRFPVSAQTMLFSLFAFFRLADNYYVQSRIPVCMGTPAPGTHRCLSACCARGIAALNGHTVNNNLLKHVFVP